MALKQIRIHHSAGRYRIYECSYCGKHVSKYYHLVQTRKHQSCGCLRRNGLLRPDFDGVGAAIPRKTLRLHQKITYRGVERPLREWLELHEIPQTVFNRWYADGREPKWIIARYANGVKS